MLLAIVSLPLQAADYQVHGFAAQGGVFTDHYDFFGNSSEGKASYYELGINGSLQLTPSLIASAQGILRDAGSTDSGKPRLDLALVDYRIHSTATHSLGLRAGRVKNPLGFYNETRDVIFTRPSILLPQSVYNETQGLRSLLFSSDGAQVYGDLQLGGHTASLTATVATDRKLGEQEKSLLVNLGGEPFDLEITRLWSVQAMDAFGPWRFGYSFTSVGFSLETDPSFDLSADVDVEFHVVSAAWDGERLSLTAEYSALPQRARLVSGGASDHSSFTGDGGYLQAEYRVAPQWTVLGRYDLSFDDRADRYGRRYAEENPGAHRYEVFGRDLTLGVNWRSPMHWGVWGEVHLTDGALSVPALENDTYDHRHWTTWMLMVAYRL